MTTPTFWKKTNRRGRSVTDVGSPCWLWLGAISTRGYGLAWDGHKLVGAHRLAWALKNGRSPGKLQVMHRCDTRACVRPSHLVLGTQADNEADKRSKGRAVYARGERSPHAKLTAAAVRAIRKDTRIQRVVAAHFGVDQATVCRIKRRTAWAHVEN